MELIYRGIKVSHQFVSSVEDLSHQNVQVLFRGQAWTWFNWDKELALPQQAVVCYRGLILV